MTVLSVNLNKIAVLRNSRDGHRPSIVAAARTVISAGVKGITVHPRPDQRHIRPQDVYDLSALLNDEFPNVEFNIEGNPHAAPTSEGYPGFDALIRDTAPDQATLVPDSDDQLTSDHGWDLSAKNEELASKISLYQSYGARVSLFMDPELEQIEAAKAHGTDRIELYTGPLAETIWTHGVADARSQACLETYAAAARYAHQIGLGVNAGHDLDLGNLSIFCQQAEINEVSIGHALVSDALEFGLFETARKYLALIPPD
ncbi:MAG: pyridoxine 5'-phosphate synthase [Pseudomonadales bacterium]|nr:pyridoxine 5'-phosphate synthase [Pseudomonadales bacterium]